MSTMCLAYAIEIDLEKTVLLHVEMERGRVVVEDQTAYERETQDDKLFLQALHEGNSGCIVSISWPVQEGPQHVSCQHWNVTWQWNGEFWS